MFILKKGHQPGVYMPLRALFLVVLIMLLSVRYHTLPPEVKTEAQLLSLGKILPLNKP